MALTSTSTRDEAETEFLATASYRQDANTALAHRHAIACRHLILKTPSTSVKGSNTISYSISVLERMMEAAEAFAVSGGAGNVVRPDFRGMRDHG